MAVTTLRIREKPKEGVARNVKSPDDRPVLSLAKEPLPTS
jgi:hypothetical protein